MIYSRVRREGESFAISKARRFVTSSQPQARSFLATSHLSLATAFIIKRDQFRAAAIGKIPGTFFRRQRI
jgi:hypothetical protein